MCSDFSLILESSPQQGAMASQQQQQQQQQQQHQQHQMATGSLYSDKPNKHSADDDIEFVSCKPVKKPRLGIHGTQETRPSQLNATGSRLDAFIPESTGPSQLTCVQPTMIQGENRNGMIAPVPDMSLDPQDTTASSAFASFTFPPTPLPPQVNATRTSEAISPRQLPQPKISPMFAQAQPQPFPNPPVASNPSNRLDQISCLDIGNFGSGRPAVTTPHSASTPTIGPDVNKSLGVYGTGAAQPETRDPRTQPGYGSPYLTGGWCAAGSVASAPVLGGDLRLLHSAESLGSSQFNHGRPILGSYEGHPPHTSSSATAPVNMHSKRLSSTAPGGLIPRQECPGCISRAPPFRPNIPPYYPHPLNDRLPLGFRTQQPTAPNIPPPRIITGPALHRPNIFLPPLQPGALLGRDQIQPPVRSVAEHEGQQQAQQRNLQPVPAAIPKKKPTKCMYVDMAETVERIFPSAEFAAIHGTSEDKVKEALAAIIQLPLLKGSEKRRAGQLAHDRVRELREIRRQNPGEDTTTVAGLTRALDTV